MRKKERKKAILVRDSPSRGPSHLIINFIEDTGNQHVEVWGNVKGLVRKNSTELQSIVRGIVCRNTNSSQGYRKDGRSS